MILNRLVEPLKLSSQLLKKGNSLRKLLTNSFHRLALLMGLLLTNPHAEAQAKLLIRKHKCARIILKYGY